MNDGLMLKIQASTQQAVQRLNSVTQSFKSLGSQSNKTSSNMGKFQTNMKKLNNQFTNLNRDANRADLSLGKLGKSFNVLSSAINVAKIYALGNAIAKAIQSSLDMIETNNLFEVSLGSMSEKADETVQRLHEIYGLDTTNLRNSIGTYAMLARSMGMSSGQAEVLSTSTAQLALELSSLTNVPINQVMGDLRSGLLGQSETVYKYGMDVTEAGLKQEALRQGITKSVRDMSQGEKMALRYAVMVRQSGIAHGDFAKTIESPSNQLKMLSERMTTLSRTIGTIFIPMLQVVLPYVNAFVQVLIDLASALASLVGYELPSISNKDGIGSISEDVDGVGDSFGDATKSAEKFKKTVMGFDNVNIIPEPQKDSGSANGGIGGSILDGMAIPEYDIANSPFNKVTELVTKFKDELSELDKKLNPLKKSLKKLWDEGFKELKDFTWKGIKDFYDKFLVPISDYALSDKGLPKLVGIVNDFIKDINWDSLNKALERFWDNIKPFVTDVWDGAMWLADNILDPILNFALNFVLPTGLDLLGITLKTISTDLKTIGAIWTPAQKFFDYIKDFSKWYADLPEDEKIGAIWEDILGERSLWLSDGVEQLESLGKGDFSGFGKKVEERFDRLKLKLGELKEFFSFPKSEKAEIDVEFKEDKKSLEEKWNELTVSIKDKTVEFKAKIATKVSEIKEKWNELSLEFKNKMVNFGIKIGQKYLEIREKWQELSKEFKAKTVNFGIKVATLVETVKTKWANLSKEFKDKTAEFKIKFATVASNMKEFINGVIKAINDNVIAKLDFDINVLGMRASWKAPRIQPLAMGGIVNDPTVALVGEAGKEAVMPLENNTGWIKDLAGQIVGFGGTSMNESQMYSAFKRAIDESSGDTVIRIDSRDIARASKKGTKRLDRDKVSVSLK